MILVTKWSRRRTKKINETVGECETGKDRQIACHQILVSPLALFFSEKWLIRDDAVTWATLGNQSEKKLLLIIKS